MTNIIDKIDISNGNLSCGFPDSNGFYNLKNIILSVNSIILKKDRDYSIEVQVQEVDGYYESIVTVYGLGNYTGEKTQSFRTGKVYIDINIVDISINNSELLYSGEQQFPEIITDLQKDIDYKISLPNDSVNIGSYDIKITGIGEYNNTRIISYRIIKQSIEEANVSFGEPNENGYYNISNITVTLSGRELIKFTDYAYNVTDENEDDESGLVESSVEIRGINNYTGTKIVKVFTEKSELYPGKKIELSNSNIYARYSSQISVFEDQKSGTFYLWDNIVKNKKIRITNNLKGVGKLGYITGWIDIRNLEQKDGISLGDKVVVNGRLNTSYDGTGNFIRKINDIMYVVNILDPDKFEYCYGLSSGPNRNRQGWAKQDDIKLLKE